MSDTRDLETDINGFLRYLLDIRKLSKQTVRAYASDLASFSSWVERAGINAYDLGHRDIRAYLADMRQARYSGPTVRRHLSALRGFYRWLEREQICDVGTVEATVSPKSAKRLPKTMSNDDVTILLNSCDLTSDEGLRDRAFLELLYATGARISELSRLDVADINMRSKTVLLFGKGSKERLVPLYPLALDAVRAYLVHARSSLLAHAKNPSNDAQRALFVSTRGRRMSADALRVRFSRAVQLSGIQNDVSPHTMRHTYATELLSGGADLRSVQELLGHASLETTQIYTHLSVERLKETARQAHPRAE